MILKHTINAYQIKFFLDDCPSIWRKIIVPGDINYFQLHAAIQDTMGWEDNHLHEFKVNVVNLSHRLVAAEEFSGLEQMVPWLLSSGPDRLGGSLK